MLNILAGTYVLYNCAGCSMKRVYMIYFILFLETVTSL